MNEMYFVSLLLVAGTCSAFAFHAATLAVQTRNQQYVDLLLLSLLQAIYCGLAYRYFRLTEADEALPWGQTICVFTPYMTYLFGRLTAGLAPGPAWLGRFQQANLLLAVLFSAAALRDALFGGGWVMAGLATDLTSAHRHRLSFTWIGELYLGFVSLAFILFASLLFRTPGLRRELLPLLVGCVAYFATTIFDFGILTGLRDGYFLQHLGFFALVCGSWRVLGLRFESSVQRLQNEVARLEEQRKRLLLAGPMLQKQRLDDLGTLTAALAHEMKNPLQGILVYADLLKRASKHDSTTHDYARKIDQESERLANIVRGVLSFGRQDAASFSEASVDEIVSGSVTLVQGALRQDDVALHVNLPAGLPALRCRPYQLQQVLVNLINNASAAVLARSSQRRDDRAVHLTVEPITRAGAPWIRVLLRDTGDGVDASVVEQLFEPFVTTKGKSGGTGLGLAISRGIVEAHGGSLRLLSTHDHGTTFMVELPCALTQDHPSLASA